MKQKDINAIIISKGSKPDKIKTKKSKLKQFYNIN